MSLGAACFLATASLRASRESAALRNEAFALAYNLDHPQAITVFRKAIAADPADPAAYRGIATITWLNIMVFRRGTATVDDYLSNTSKSNMRSGSVPPDQARLFRDNTGRALELAEKQVKANPRDASAHYELGATEGIIASYIAFIEGRMVGALQAARQAYNEHQEVVRLDPRRKDAGLVLGSYRYVVSDLSLPTRLMAYVVGLRGGRARGLQLIEQAAASPSDAQPDAQFLLVFLYNREKRYDDALRVIGELQRRYPRNRLLWLNAGGTALRAGRAALADSILSEGIGRLERDTRPRIFGELALWRYKRGAARVALRRPQPALADLRAALHDEARDWVRGRVHLELGKLSDLAGDRGRARAEYEKALSLCQRDNDPVGAREAQRLKVAGYKG